MPGRWITPPRVLLALCMVLLSAAINRRDFGVFTVFVLLSVVTLLARLWPWVSLRRLELERANLSVAETARSLVQGEPLDLGLTLVQRGRWPVWMVCAEAHWEWAGHRFVSRTHLSALWPGRGQAVLRQCCFDCRGAYALRRVSVSCGFPLGLVVVERELAFEPFTVRVCPAPQALAALPALSLAEQPLGERVLPGLGDSDELRGLRTQEAGHPMGRIDWRASARRGELVERVFQRRADVSVCVALLGPDAASVSWPDSPAERALRAAAQLCDVLVRACARVRLVPAEPVPAEHMPTQGWGYVLAAMPPEKDTWSARLAEGLGGLKRGEMLLAVAAVDAPIHPFVAACDEVLRRGAALSVMVALWDGAPKDAHQQAQQLHASLQEHGVRAWLAC